MSHPSPIFDPDHVRVDDHPHAPVQTPVQPPERQLDLLNPPAPRVRAEDVVTLCVHLQRAQDGVFKQSKRWVTARALRDAYPAWSDRKIRAIAAASEGQIISGQKGYCLTACATNEEIRRAVAWLRSQALKMESRAADILRRQRV
jgi:hypothetical protein|tara:strand:+ start:1202 stop:1636 length:435 start_codon:yes stop_codon:yes gene_type:complete